MMSNTAFPTGVKVGFTLKDPELRARELSHTGVPAAWIVEYEAFVPNPRDVEQLAHKALKGIQYNKEFFQCTAAEAVAVIKEIAGSIIEIEHYKRVDRTASLEILNRKRNLKEKNEALERTRKNYQFKLDQAIAEMNQIYDSKIQKSLPQRNGKAYWFVTSIALWLGFELLGASITRGVGNLILSILLGGIASTIFIERQKKRDMQSSEVLILKDEKNNKVSEIISRYETELDKKIYEIEEMYRLNYQIPISDPKKNKGHESSKIHELKSSENFSASAAENFNFKSKNFSLKDETSNYLTSCIICGKAAERAEWKQSEIGPDWKICPNCKGNIELQTNSVIEKKIETRKTLNPHSPFPFDTNIRP